MLWHLANARSSEDINISTAHLEEEEKKVRKMDYYHPNIGKAGGWDLSPLTRLDTTNPIEATTIKCVMHAAF